ncbi:hypothetical protein BCR33DRAFT_715123 [Rhizoclosmatium globosum]|uniref:Uncharacterized protein n=1 Tax=Rhizoclosmatium globosum TaxID=329046 RepID=A0A1Y2CK55_9FUNG|nr:hypothetical protein BCR33DRAFT_715123 [Rhizoclosmatium globosum]|eukprot:ORY47401.1 hypothetical protein BCR33DRAFT_715123 [Rhizoclosmatium globosum]
MFELGTQEVLNRHLALSLNPSLIPDIPSDLVSTYQTLSNITETSNIPSKELFQVLPETQKTISLRAETIVMSQSSRNTSHVFALAVETLTISFDSRRLDAILKRLSCGPILSNNDYADVKAILAHAGCDDPAVAVMCDALHLELCIFKLNPHWVVAVNQFWTAMAPCQFRPSATVAVVAWWIKTFDLTKPVRLLITRLLAVVSRSSGTVCYSLKKFSKHPRAAEIFEEAFTSSFHSLLTKDGITDSLAQLFLSMKAANRHTSTSLLLLALMFLSKQPQIELDEAHFSALFPPTAGELLGIYQSCEYKDFQDAVSPR